MASKTGSSAFDRLREAFARDPALRQELEWAYRLAVETYNPSDRGLRFITGGIGEWIITLAAYHAGILTLPGGHNADGHDTEALRSEVQALWSVKTSYQTYSPAATFTITNGQGGPGAGLVVPTIFLAPGLPGIVFVSPEVHPSLVAQVVFGKSEAKLRKGAVHSHASAHPECVIPFTMPVNPGAAVKDPGFEAVRLLLDSVHFPRLRLFFQDAAASRDATIVTQVQRLKRMRDEGGLTEQQYQGLLDKLSDTRGSSH